MHTIELSHVSKALKGVSILSDITLTFTEGMIYGLIGRNGSGKTMLMRAMSGLLHPDAGTIRVDGKLLYREIDVVPNLGVVIENVGLYPEYTGFQNLKMLAAIRKRVDDAQIKATIARFGLDPDDKRVVRKYSLGMRQKIALAQAFMEQPDFLLLDEPTNGLDQETVRSVRRICKEEAARGAMICIASHSQDDIRLLCDAIYTMDAGQVRPYTLPKEEADG